VRQARPPASVDGTAGTAIAIAAGYEHSLAISAPEPGALVLGVATFVALGSRARRRRGC